jgi:hypothetical protein
VAATPHPAAFDVTAVHALVSGKSGRVYERAVLTNRPSLELSP